MCVFTNASYMSIICMYAMWHCLHGNSCMFILCGIVCIATAACLNNSQQLLSNLRHFLMCVLGECTINAHNFYACMQLLSTTGRDGTSLLIGNLFSDALAMV